MLSAHKASIRAAFHHAATQYDEHAHLQRQVTEQLLTTIVPHLHPGATLLDLGCGTGYFGRCLAEQPIPHQLYQLDIATDMCKKANNHARTNHYCIQGDIDHLPIADHSMSCVMSSMAFQWLDDLSSVFRSIGHILTEKGFFSCAFVGNGSLAELQYSFEAHGYPSPLNHFPGQQELIASLKQANMTEASISSIPMLTHHDGIIELLQHFKQLGAHHRNGHQAPVRLTKGMLQHIESTYRKRFCKGEKKLPASWNIYFIQWVKKESVLTSCP